MMGGMMGGMMGSSGDFTIVGYNSEKSMTSFINGTASIVDGTIFEEGTSNNDCIISQELAVYNDLTVGDSITVSNPNSEEELYELHIVGIYTDTASNESTTAFMRSAASDPANKIIMSYPALNAIVESSAENSTTQTDENTGMEYETKIKGTLAGTYVFSDVEAYEQFEKEVRNMGLGDSYTVSSPDIMEYENSLTPLNTLSTMAGWFLVVILLIGAIILIVLNIFNVRERKYEIGVLTAMGMKKSKVALQFLTEIFVVTLAAVIIGAGIGAVSSVVIIGCHIVFVIGGVTIQCVGNLIGAVSKVGISDREHISVTLVNVPDERAKEYSLYGTGILRHLTDGGNHFIH